MLSKLTTAVASSVRAKIVLLVLAAVAVTALCSGIFIVQTRSNIQAEVFRNQSAVAHTYAGLVDQFLGSARGAVESAAGLPSLRAPLNLALSDPAIHGIPFDADPRRRADMAASYVLSDRLVSLMLTAPSGEPYALEPYARQAKFRDASVASQPHFQRVTETGLTAWSDVFSVNLNGSEVPAVVIAVPIKDADGQIESVLSSPIRLEGLSAAASKIPHSESGQLMLFDSLGAPIVYPDPALVEAMEPLVEHPLVAAALAGRTASQAYHNPLNGLDELGTAVPLENGWFAVVTQSQTEAFDGLNRSVATLLLVVSTGVVILLTAGLLLANSIARGMGAVSRAATGLAAGDLDQEVDVWSRDEMGRMAASFRKMIAYHQSMAAIADAVAAGDLSADVEPESERDRLGIALHGMVGNLRALVESLRIRDRALAAATSPVVITESTGGPFGPVVYANPAFERLTGYAVSEVVGRSMEVLRGPQTDPATVEKFFSITREGRADTNEIVAYRKDGTTVWTEVAAAPVRDTNGKVTHYVWVISDISERKEAETNAHSLARAEKLRALGQMASGIAHDLNQSLMLIASYGQIGGRALDVESIDRAELRELFTVVTQAALDGGDSVKRLLQFAQLPSERDLQPIDLTLLAREVAQLTAPRWRDAAQASGHPIALEVEAVGHPVILGAAAALREALTNLVLNAVDALPDGGTIRLRVSRSEDQAVIEVVDDGVGMAPEVQSHIFEPFFTTKGEGGTGLGLATVFGLVERLGGQVRVQSAPGAGTTFRLEFTATAAVAVRDDVAKAGPHNPDVPRRRLRVLAVDDEPSLTRAVMRLLKPIGHIVTMASSGEESLEKLASEPFDLVLSDVGMGAGMNGWELAERVRSGWPEVRFALATGWGAAIDPVAAREKGVVAVLAKPYSVSELEEVLAAA